MEKYKVLQYQSDYYSQWNDFVAKAKNATFLFHRDFMEYHKERFQDFSLIIVDNKNRIRALLPANIVGNQLFSHQGLSYGGLIIDDKLKLDKYIILFQSLLQFLERQSISELILKPIPNFYCSNPSEEINYLLHLVKANLFRVDSTATIDLKSSFQIDKSRLEGVKKAQILGLKLEKVEDCTHFWNDILIPNLKERHGLNPVHTLDEIHHLKQKFPKNILQFNVYQKEELLAGATVFVNGNVVHVQYISGIGNKNQHGALDFLFYHLLQEEFKDYAYFDFGNSNEEYGTKLNQGLHFWKEGFGARTYVHNFYSVIPKNEYLLNHVIFKK